MKTIVQYTSANGLYPGIGGIFMSIAFFSVFINFFIDNYSGIIISLLLFIIGYIGFFVRVHIKYDEKQNSLLIEKYFFIKKTKQTYSLHTYRYIQILYTIGKVKQRTYGYIETTWKKTQSKHFDVYIISSDSNNPPVLVKNFIDKKKALIFLKDIASKLQLQAVKSSRKV
ncbi:MAG: hypothetical protein ACOCWB_03110 [Bacteroidota bacterium]